MFWQYFVKFTIKNMKTFSCWYCFTMNNEKKNEEKKTITEHRNLEKEKT